MLSTPVALLVFNRPEVTARVFAAIAAARPTRLFIIGDGPRPNRPGEAELCEGVRRVVEEVDWPCEVTTSFAGTNLGCKRRVATGIDWVFSQTEEAIFLEDDCLPDPSFFRYCEEMLRHFRTDTRVMHIGGTNFQQRQKPPKSSYYFSRHVHVWGWASWRRAWSYYDVGIGAWPSIRDSDQLRAAFPDATERRTAARLLNGVFAGKIDTWDAQWTLACRLQHALSVLPSTNLVSNIGFGLSATHTSDPRHPVANLSVGQLAFPLSHPPIMLPDAAADAQTVKTFRSSFYRRARSVIFRALHKRVASSQERAVAERGEFAAPGLSTDQTSDLY